MSKKIEIKSSGEYFRYDKLTHQALCDCFGALKVVDPRNTSNIKAEFKNWDYWRIIDEQDKDD